MDNNSNKEITAKQAGNIVKHMIADVEQKMAAGLQVNAGPLSEDEAKDLQKAREVNQKGT